MKTKYVKKQKTKSSLKIKRRDYKSAKSLKTHLEKEHPSTKGKIRIV